MKKLIIGSSLIVLVAVLGLYYLHQPYNVYRRMKLTTQQCVVAEKNIQVYILCDQGQGWIPRYQLVGGGWQKIEGQPDTLNAFTLIYGDDIKRKIESSFTIPEGGITVITSRDKRKYIKEGEIVLVRYDKESNVSIQIKDGIRNYLFMYYLKDNQPNFYTQKVWWAL